MSEIIKIKCDTEGYGEFWIEYDVSTWGIAEYTDMPTQTPFNMMRAYITKYVVAWNIMGDDGAMAPCPKPGSPWESWQQAFKQIGPKTGTAIYSWLYLSPFAAMTLKLNPPPKSDVAG